MSRIKYLLFLLLIFPFLTVVNGSTANEENGSFGKIEISINDESYHYCINLEGLTGPNDFAVSDDTVAILDSVTDCVYLYDFEGNFLKKFFVGNDEWLTNLVYYEGNYYVADTMQTIYQYSPDGTLISQDTSFCTDWENYMYGLYTQDDNLYAMTTVDGYVLLEGDTETELPSEEKMFEDLAKYFPGASMSGSYVGKNEYGNYYVVEALIEQPSCVCYTMLVQYDKENCPVGCIMIDSSDWNDVVWRGLNEVTISDDGFIYVIRYFENCIKIEKYQNLKPYDMNTFEEYCTKLQTEVNLNDSCEEILTNETASSVSTTLSRNNVIATCMNYVNHQWTLNSANKTLRGGTMLPSWISSVTSLPGIVRGIPYCWGGKDSLSEFDSHISAGYMAGNVNATGDYKLQTAGVDCSGLVGETYGNSGYTSTYSLISSYSVTSWTSMCKGDYILMRTDVDGNSNGTYNASANHVVIFYLVPTSGYIQFVDSSLTEGKVKVRALKRSDMIAADYVPHTYWTTSHYAGSTWKYDSLNHWHVCGNGCGNANTKYVRTAHTFAGSTCSICGYTAD